MPHSKTPQNIVSVVLPDELAARVKALRVEGQNIFSVSTVLRAAIQRGLNQLELERSLGRSICNEPLPLTD